MHGSWKTMNLQSCKQTGQNNDSKNLHRTGIVIPSFNQGRFIERTIISVLENARHCPIKLIVMDGGSTDDTVSILKKYSSRIDYWQSKPDGGQASAINSGMKFLNDCEFVTWLNSDDEYENEWSVCTIVRAMQEKSAQVAYGRSNLIDECGNVISEYPVCENATLQRLSIDCGLSQPSVFMRKSVWDQVGGLNPKLQMCLDYDMWIRLAKHHTLVYVDAVIGNTRIYDQTKTSLNQQRHLLEGIYTLNRHYGVVPYTWIHEKYVQDKFGGPPSTFMQKLYKRIDLKLRYEKIKTAYIKEAERVMNR